MQKLIFFVIGILLITLSMPLLGMAQEGIQDPAEAWDSQAKLWFYISAIIWLIVMIPLLWFSFKYRRKKPGREENGAYIHGNLGLEILWTAIPTVIVILLAAVSWDVFNELRRPPADAYEAKVEGYQFGFEMIYPEGFKTANELVVPEGPVKLLLGTRDVVHSFYIPQYRTKEDMIPGRTTYIYFLAKKPGKYPKSIYCAEYCGTRHSLMLADLEVKPKEDFQAWVAEKTEAAVKATPEERGKEKIQACLGCHSLTGEKLFGPTFKGLIGKERQLQDGSTVVADEAYITESIRHPSAKVVKDYPAAMPAYGADQLTDQDIEAIIAYLNTLQ